jgi:hypothetical protein
MTKSPHKLILRKDTLRTLNTVDLRRVVGGGDDAQANSPITKITVCIQREIVTAPTM